jgi:hypothetical protein
MTNGELIAELSKLDADLPVTAGEDGVDVTGAVKSDYSDDAGSHDCVYLYLADGDEEL